MKPLEKKTKAANLLKELLVLLESNDSNLQSIITTNCEKNIYPLLQKLKIKLPNYSDIIVELELAIKNVFSPFTQTIIDPKWNLTPSEQKICQGVKNGLSTKEIATQFNISTTTVNEHKSNSRKKLGLKRQENLKNFLDRIDFIYSKK